MKPGLLDEPLGGPVPVSWPIDPTSVNNRTPYEYPEDEEDTQETSVSSERNHDEVWKEDIELPERKESKQIPNPWE